MQPVWRGDRPQKGRYREFYQCDADVVGTDSLICEAEIVMMLKEVFSNLGIKDFSIKINNRKILEGIASIHGFGDKLTDLTVAIDKLDKIGPAKVIEELIEKGFQRPNGDQTPAKDIVGYFLDYKNKGTDSEKINFLKEEFKKYKIEIGLKGVEEIEKIYNYTTNFTSNSTFNIQNLEFDISLARGLSYYTGAIFEVKANNVSIGSISGGGRYDNLTGVFGLPGVSGVGISFGVDRIYDVMEELQLFPSNSAVSTKVLLCYFDEESEKYSLPLLYQLRASGINSELFPEAGKLKKPLNYANSKGIPYAVIVGSDEMKSGELTIKDMLKGEQERLTIDKIIQKLK
jgi:histidyl-tRNA synthetase